ncbi:head GIN domain-containing protein [Mucilaginibacter sp. L3T2-6]|uniref:head GIN domain-containing protein n=1 Tax=Mucilaginibacter sp. L3T2-6 TaxID=3062491 RepID=UPI002676BA78|nr:head GIN domain-containing protein [Mucilaginibacter sp. L3T2-6]MDO3640792.1 head GIN domain-containing protein [Mucilaginibacter sp. L3T2-6]MDV6212867.1 head GIN domain-containing protein [Mucilaginibacter sp. L3T2-6]
MKRIVYTIVAAMLVAATSIKASAQSDESRSVSGFNGIGSGGPFDVHVKIDGTESLKIKASQEAIKEIDTYVKDGKLQIKFKHHDRWNDHDFGRIDIYITAKSLSSLANAGSGSIKVDGSITGDATVALSGSGNISTSVKASRFHVAISGSGSVDLSGTANETKVSIAGSGDMNGKRFKTATANVSIAGSGNAHFGADKTVSATIVGSGNVYYSGSATVENTRTVGSGRVTRE